MESSPFASQRAWAGATSRPSDFSWDSNQVGDQPATPVMQPVPGQADGGGLNADDGVRPRAELEGTQCGARGACERLFQLAVEFLDLGTLPPLLSSVLEGAEVLDVKVRQNPSSFAPNLVCNGLTSLS